MTAEKLAVIVYGVTAYLAALVLGVMAGSKIAVALVFAAAGIAYIFQVAQLAIGEDALFDEDGRQTGASSLLAILMFLAIGAAILSVVISLLFVG